MAYLPRVLFMTTEYLENLECMSGCEMSASNGLRGHQSAAVAPPSHGAVWSQIPASSRSISIAQCRHSDAGY